MSELSLLLDTSSVSSRTSTRATPFRVYLSLGKNPGVECTPAQGGHAYYATLGFGFSNTCYNKSGAAAWLASEADSYIAAQNSSGLMPYIDVYYHDYEGTYYNFSTTDAATCIADTTSLVSALKSKLTAYGLSNPKVGIYTPNGAGGATKGPTVTTTAYWVHSAQTRKSWRDDNLACATIQSTWDAIFPENYSYRLDQFAMKTEIFCQEKAAVGGTAKLIPVFQPTISGTSCTADQMYNVLKYSYECPEMDGLMLWTYFKDPSPAPTYYDDQDWMVGAKQFMIDYNITRGTPF